MGLILRITATVNSLRRQPSSAAKTQPYKEADESDGEDSGDEKEEEEEEEGSADEEDIADVGEGDPTPLPHIGALSLRRMKRRVLMWGRVLRTVLIQDPLMMMRCPSTPLQCGRGAIEVYSDGHVFLGTSPSLPLQRAKAFALSSNAMIGDCLCSKRQ